MIKEFKNLKEIKKYYDKKTNTYIFKEDGLYIMLVSFKFDLKVKANIKAIDINAWNIKALDIESRNIDALDIETRNINAFDIDARDIKASNINYYAVCFAYNNIKCKSIKGRKHNAKHFVLDGTLEVEENEK